jgi:hypothetical protein
MTQILLVIFLRQLQYILSRLGVTYNAGLDRMIEFIAPHTFTQFETIGNTALPLFYTLSSSPLHMDYDSQPSLVVSWQWIYQSLTVTSNHT